MTHTPGVSEDRESLLAISREDACLAACAGIPTEKLRPGIVRELIDVARTTCGLNGSVKWVLVKGRARRDFGALIALLRELGEP